MDEPLEKRVLRAMTEGLDSTIGVAVALGKPESDIQRSVNVMMLAGLISVTPEDGKRITLTPAGQEAATARSSLVFQSSTVVRSGDVEDIGRLISATWTMSQASQKASGKRAESRLLVTDTERESAVAALADGYATGCLSLEELNQRTGRARATQGHCARWCHVGSSSRVIDACHARCRRDRRCYNRSRHGQAFTFLKSSSIGMNRCC